MKLTMWILIVCCYGLTFVYGQGDRVAPGVPPQHYQQYQQVPTQQIPQHGNVPQQQYNQPQVHQQQVHQQPIHQQQAYQQQVPVQQHQGHQQHVPTQQQHVPVQQQPHGHGQQAHGHGHNHGQPQQILNAANIAHEKEHIQEHMQVPIDTSKMSEQELQFHYFKMHDADNNNKLDGCELIKSLIHWHENGAKEHTPEVGEKNFKDSELEQLIDPIVAMDDTNRDGFIDYPEFIRAQQKSQGEKPSP